MKPYFTKILQSVQNELAQVTIPAFPAAFVGEDFKRYLKLYMLGMYLEGEHTKEHGADASHVVLMWRKDLQDYMRKSGWTHYKSEIQGIKGIGIKGAPVSFSYDNSTTMSKGHKSDFLLLDLMARKYALSKHTPFAVVMKHGGSNDAWKAAGEWLKKETVLTQDRLRPHQKNRGVRKKYSNSDYFEFSLKEMEAFKNKTKWDVP